MISGKVFCLVDDVWSGYSYPLSPQLSFPNPNITNSSIQFNSIQFSITALRSVSPLFNNQFQFSAATSLEEEEEDDEDEGFVRDSRLKAPSLPIRKVHTESEQPFTGSSFRV